MGFFDMFKKKKDATQEHSTYFDPSKRQDKVKIDGDLES